MRTRQPKNPKLVALGHRLRALREGAGLTQEELAFRADLNAKYYGCVERGEKDISYLRLLAIFEVVGAGDGEVVP